VKKKGKGWVALDTTPNQSAVRRKEGCVLLSVPHLSVSESPCPPACARVCLIGLLLTRSN
jgi:hypothetical protein